ncbi:MFS transporter [Pseudactinotalea suaedae]|uniref:MFS transporter n=1 Tax=Pseudactinotalea suaedae TaxID=1524924 RepID=UPI00344C16E6
MGGSTWSAPWGWPSGSPACCWRSRGGATGGWLSPATLGLLGGGVVVLLGWGIYEMRVTNPLVDLRVSARAPVLLTNLASVAMGFALFGSNIVFPQLLELPAELGGLGLDILAASMIMMPAGLAMLAVSPLAGRIERRTGPKALFVAGGAVIALSYAVAVALDLRAGHILAINIAIGVGIGLGYAAMPTLIMRAVPAHETGAANGLNTLMRSLGTSTAAAVVGAVLAGASTAGGAASGPSSSGFATALLLCLVAAVLCAVVAALIPAPRAHVGEHTSLPD